MTIYLIGSMGVGKSAIGRTIATQLALPYYDTDQELVSEVGKSINEIFQDHGEPYFRSLESLQIRKKYASESQIISTGGGLPVTEGNMDYMLENGVVLFLEASIEDIVARLNKGKHKRPAIKSLSMSEIKDKLVHMIEERGPIYKRAHLSYMRSQDIEADARELSTYFKMFT